MIKIGLIGNDGHLTEKAFEALRAGSLCDEALDCVLEHIGSCEKCADLYAQSFDECELLQPPSGFGEELDKRLKQSDLSARQSFFSYAFRVAVAACAALIITFSGSLDIPVKQIKAPDFKAVNSVSAHLKDFSQHLVDMEVFK
jgi:hypothetical protein